MTIKNLNQHEYNHLIRVFTEKFGDEFRARVYLMYEQNNLVEDVVKAANVTL